MNQRIIIERSLGGGHYDDAGKFHGGDVESIGVWASVQPLSGRQVQLLPEGRRNDESLEIYTMQPVFAASTSRAQKADIIIWQERRFEVWSVKYWYDPSLGHYQTTALAETD